MTDEIDTSLENFIKNILKIPISKYQMDCLKRMDKHPKFELNKRRRSGKRDYYRMLIRVDNMMRKIIDD